MDKAYKPIERVPLVKQLLNVQNQGGFYIWSESQEISNRPNCLPRWTFNITEHL